MPRNLSEAKSTLAMSARLTEFVTLDRRARTEGRGDAAPPSVLTHGLVGEKSDWAILKERANQILTECTGNEY